jgi:hypothetical protein
MTPPDLTEISAIDCNGKLLRFEIYRVSVTVDIDWWISGRPVSAQSESRMLSDLALRCRCGHMRGVASNVSPSSGFRFVCYCKDCQAFARFLDRADVLDAAGGTDIFHMPPGRVKLTVGTDALQCLQLSDKVLRWYAECCRTPIANTPARPGFPVIGMIHSFMDHEADSRSRDEVLGPPLCSIFERSAIGPLARTRPARRLPGFSLVARQNCSVGGCKASVVRRRSLMIGRRLPAPCLACSRRASVPLSDQPSHSHSIVPGGFEVTS